MSTEGTGVDWDALQAEAVAASRHAYAPYSTFAVGAAALVDDGRLVTGCNVENAAYGVGLCAECGLVSRLHLEGGGRLTHFVCVGGAVGTEVGYFGWMAGLCNSWVFPLEGLRMRRRCVLTNNRPNFLGHGGLMLSTNAAIMQLINTTAKKIDRDPIDLLYQNAIEEGHTGLSGEWFASCGLRECIETVRKASDWDNRYGKLESYHGLGVGIGSMAAGAKGAFRHDTSAVMVRVGEDGIVTVYTGIPDMGQGTHTTMAVIVAEVLGIDPNDMKVIAGDTDLTPIDVGAFAQRGTIQTGNAARNAALDAREQLTVYAAGKLEVDKDDLVFRGGKVYAQRATGAESR